MRYLAIILLLAGAAWGQTYTFPNVNTDLNAHQFNMPIPCPSTTPANCIATNNQALNGANSIFAECDFANSGGISNPECSGAGGAQVVGVTTNSAATHNYVHIVRVTDYTVSHTGAEMSNAAQMGDNAWSADATRLAVGRGDWGYYKIFSFDPNPASPTYLQSAPLYPNLQIKSASVWFSRVKGPYSGGRTESLMYTVSYSQDIPGLVASGDVPTSHVVIAAWDFSSKSTAPSYTQGNVGTITVVKDLNTAECIGASAFDGSNGPAFPPMNNLTVSQNDDAFSLPLGYSGCGNNGMGGCSGHYDQEIVYSTANNTCAVLHLDTGLVTGFDGVSRTYIEQTSGQNFTSHSSGSGNPNFMNGGLMYIEGAGGAGGACTPSAPCGAQQRWSWETGLPYTGHPSPTGTKLWKAGDSHNGMGHSSAGVLNYNRDGDGAGTPTYGGEAVQSFDAVKYYSLNAGLINPNNSPYQSCYLVNSNTTRPCGCDSHRQWVLASTQNDNAPYMAIHINESLTMTPNSASQASTPLPIAWCDEIDLWPTNCVPGSCPGNPAWRVAHTLINEDLEFLAKNNYTLHVAAASMTTWPVNGLIFIAFTSDWQGQLGCQNGTYDTTSTHPGYVAGCVPRGDIFVAAVPVTNPATTYYFPWHI